MKSISKFSKIIGAAALICGLLAVAQVAVAQDYDLVILNGRVMDPESMYDAVANVGVNDGRIAVITKDEITGKETIDATGHVVAPGFIDTHWHYDRPWSNKLALRDGRTTVLDLEIGTHGPYLDQWYKERVGKNQVNYGQAVAHEFARAEVLDGFTDGQDTRSAANSRAVGNGWCCVQPNLEEGNRILQLLDEGLQAGGLGIGSTLGYMRDGVSAREFFELQVLAGRYGRQTGAHFRYTPGTDTTEANGIQELLANAAALGSPALACHFNNPGYNLVHELLVRMRERGMNVWGEIYPYAAGSTALNAVFLEPEMWVDTLGYKYEETIQDVATGEWYTQETREQMVAKEPTRAVLVFKMPESAITDWLQLPGVTLITDGMPMIPDDDLSWDTAYEDLPNTHPRAAGSFAKAFRLARENNIPLMQIVAMSSYNSALPLEQDGPEGDAGTGPSPARDGRGHHDLRPGNRDRQGNLRKGNASLCRHPLRRGQRHHRGQGLAGARGCHPGPAGPLPARRKPLRADHDGGLDAAVLCRSGRLRRRRAGHGGFSPGLRSEIDADQMMSTEIRWRTSTSSPMPKRTSVLIMKDGKIYKNTLQ